MDRPAPGHVEDLAELANLDEQILLTEIRERYARNKIYVSRCVCVCVCVWFHERVSTPAVHFMK